jgi:hypothetical protein
VRIIVVSQDPEVAAGLVDAGVEIEMRRELAGLDAPTIVADHAFSLSHAIASIGSEQVAAVIRADRPNLSEAVRRLARAGGLGVRAGARVQSQVVADFASKRACQAAISRLTAHLPQLRRHAIDQCVDELLMNALYDAPIAEDGSRVFAGMPTRERVRLRTEQVVQVAWALDGDRFEIAVTDAFGSIDRATLLRHLAKGDADGVPRAGASGAGLGLFLVASEASALWFQVTRGVTTEVSCVFDVRDPGLAQLGYCERATTDRRTVAHKRLATRYRARRAAAVAFAALVVALVTWTVRPLFRATRILVATLPGETVELDGLRVGTATDRELAIDGLAPGHSYPVTAMYDGYASARKVVHTQRGDNPTTLALHPLATLTIDSNPSDAVVEIDGRPAGTTPLRVTTLVPGSTVALAIGKPGYTAVAVRAQIPAEGETRKIVQRLDHAPAAVLVNITSEPAGAAIVKEGEPITANRSYTPAAIYVDVGQLNRIRLVMPHYAPAEIPPFLAEPGTHVIDKHVELVPVP